MIKKVLNDLQAKLTPMLLHKKAIDVKYGSGIITEVKAICDFGGTNPDVKVEIMFDSLTEPKAFYLKTALEHQTLTVGADKVILDMIEKAEPALVAAFKQLYDSIQTAEAEITE